MTDESLVVLQNELFALFKTAAEIRADLSSESFTAEEKAKLTDQQALLVPQVFDVLRRWNPAFRKFVDS